MYKRQPELEQTPIETEEVAAGETSPEENTDEMTVEAASEAADDVTEEPVIITYEAAPEELSAENVEDASTETLETAESEVEEDFSEEPLITVEDAAPEAEQPSDENEDVLIVEAPQLADEGSKAVEEVVPEANPQDAPHESHPEIAVEEALPEMATEETAAEETENQEE